MVKKYKYNMEDDTCMVHEPMPTYGAALAEPEVEVEDYPMGLGASLAEVRQTIIEAKEHEDAPDYWITWEEIDEEFRNRYPGWK